MKTRLSYVNQFRDWLGKKESNGTHKEIIDIYNSYTPRARGHKMSYTEPWCATTVSAAAIKLGYTDIIPLECSCGRMIELAQQRGIWIEDETIVPEIGDIIMYDWNDSSNYATTDNKGWPEHVGVVETVNTNTKTLTIIEGNINDSVGRRNIAINGRYIRGYIKPKFEAYGEDFNREVDNMRYFRLNEDMNMRKTPNGTKITSIPVGTVISGTEFGKNNGLDWLYTSYNGFVGYVAVLPESVGYATEIENPNKVDAEAVNKEIETLNQQITALQSRVSNLTAELNKTIAEKNELNTVINNQNTIIIGKDAEIDKKNTEIRDKEAALAHEAEKYSYLNGQLNIKLAELEKANNDLITYKNETANLKELAEGLKALKELLK